MWKPILKLYIINSQTKLILIAAYNFIELQNFTYVFNKLIYCIQSFKAWYKTPHQVNNPETAIFPSIHPALMTHFAVSIVFPIFCELQKQPAIFTGFHFISGNAQEQALSRFPTAPSRSCFDDEEPSPHAVT